MLKLSLTAELEVHVKEETQEEFMNTHSKPESQIHHANNTSLKISIKLFANQSISAKTAHGHHAQPMKPVKTNAGLLTINTTMPVTTTL